MSVNENLEEDVMGLYATVRAELEELEKIKIVIQAATIRLEALQDDIRTEASLNISEAFRKSLESHALAAASILTHNMTTISQAAKDAQRTLQGIARGWFLAAFALGLVVGGILSFWHLSQQLQEIKEQQAIVFGRPHESNTPQSRKQRKPYLE